MDSHNNRMKQITLILLLVLGMVQAYGQVIFITESSEVSFFSGTPVEDIEAINRAGTSILNVAKSEIAFRIPISGFQFEKPLMQEHFNENYMETEKYPYASFKGRLSDSINVSTDTLYNMKASGIINIHGVDHAGTYNGTVETKEGKITLKCEFSVLLKDHRIKVPKVVFANIAEVIAVKAEFQYKPYEKK